MQNNKGELYLSINDEHQSSMTSKNLLRIKRRLKEVNLTWKIENLELDKRGVRDIFGFYFVCGFQEESFIWRHFMENHFLY